VGAAVRGAMGGTAVKIGINTRIQLVCNIGIVWTSVGGLILCVGYVVRSNAESITGGISVWVVDTAMWSSISGKVWPIVSF
jgi:hypothetical protein